MLRTVLEHAEDIFPSTKHFPEAGPSLQVHRKACPSQPHTWMGGLERLTAHEPPGIPCLYIFQLRQRSPQCRAHWRARRPELECGFFLRGGCRQACSEPCP